MSLSLFLFSSARRFGPVAAGTALVVGAAAAASAQPAPPAPPPPASAPAGRDSYVALWTVVADRPMEPTAWVGPNRAITSARLEPPRLFENRVDVKTPDGKLLVPAGMPLAGLVSRTQAACASEPLGDRGLAAAWWFGTNRFICLVDQDRDGRFERYFSLRTGPSNLIVGAGRFPAAMDPVEPAEYVERSPSTFANAPRIYVSYGHHASLVNRLIFKLCFSARRGLCLAPHTTTRREPLPQSFEMLGARFEVTGKEGDRLEITQKTEFVRQPLFIR